MAGKKGAEPVLIKKALQCGFLIYLARESLFCLAVKTHDIAEQMPERWVNEISALGKQRSKV